MYNSAFLIYGLGLAIIIGIYYVVSHSKQKKYSAILEETVEAGLTEPPSLHPSIDLTRCHGCASCITACPEQPTHTVLGVIDRQAVLVDPTSCIGHGACATACPYDAISLVFGTEKRGVDIPVISPEFETNVEGIYIAGELGGMGLIRNAINQGQQAISAISKHLTPVSGLDADVVIIGAGPAGLSASLRAMELGMKHITLEQDSLGGTVYQFPRGKLVMTAPFTLPMIGKVKLRETSKEALLRMWIDVEEKTGVKIHYGEKVDNITRTEKGFHVVTQDKTYTTKTVLLAIGRRGTPRKLNVPGENLSKVVYRLIDPEQYKGQHVLVAGGGDSALEAATSIASQPGTTVTLSYRSSAFTRAKKKNRDKVEATQQAGTLNVVMNSNITGFTENTVTIKQGDESLEIQNEAAIICAGGILPTAFLESVGINVSKKFGTK